MRFYREEEKKTRTASEDFKSNLEGGFRYVDKTELLIPLLNAAIVIVFSVLAYLLLRKFLPTVCGWLSGVKMVRGKKERESSKVK